jgi:hypothetical protein
VENWWTEKAEDINVTFHFILPLTKDIHADYNYIAVAEQLAPGVVPENRKALEEYKSEFACLIRRSSWNTKIRSLLKL